MEFEQSKKQTRTADDKARFTMKRAAIVERLGVSESTVRKRQKNGDLPYILRDGVTYSDPADVKRLADDKAIEQTSGRRMTEGQLAAAVFRMLNDGANLRDVVVELEVPPKKARQLHEEWRVPDLELARSLRLKAETAEAEADEEKRQQRAHEQRMKALDKEIERGQREQSKQAEQTRLERDKRQRKLMKRLGIE